jgi:RNA polymerase sigma-70 factor (ECF subfamily)
MGRIAATADGLWEFERDLVALVPRLRAFSRSLCKSGAHSEDMVQDTLANAWRCRDRFEPGSNLKAWVFTILRHEIYSHSRRSWRQVPWDEALSEQIPAPAIGQEWAMELADCARAMDTLPRHQREALLLVGACGLTYDEAAKKCVTTTGTMKSRVARGRASLLRILGEVSGAMTLRAHSSEPKTVGHVLAELGALTDGDKTMASSMPAPRISRPNKHAEGLAVLVSGRRSRPCRPQTTFFPQPWEMPRGTEGPRAAAIL